MKQRGQTTNYGERQLWCAVILQAIADAQMPDIPSGENDRTVARQRALNWLTKPNRDFSTVCHLAGLDPVAIRERAISILQPAVDTHA